MNGQMQGGVDWFIAQALRRVESDVSSHRSRLARADSIVDVVRAADVSIPSEVRFMRNSIPGVRSLEADAERRLDELIKAGLGKIEKKPSAAEARVEQREFLQKCSMLRGKFARQYTFADRESEQLVYRKEQAEGESRDSLGADSPD